MPKKDDLSDLTHEQAWSAVLTAVGSDHVTWLTRQLQECCQTAPQAAAQVSELLRSLGSPAAQPLKHRPGHGP